MDERELLELVRRAISLHETTGCLEYLSDKLRTRIQNDPALQQVGTPEALKVLLVRHVMSSGVIDCRRETRPEYQDRREFWFRVLVPVAGYPLPLFFELTLVDEDPDYPTALILSTHFSR